PSAHYFYVPLYVRKSYKRYAATAQSALLLADRLTGRNVGRRVDDHFSGRSQAERDYTVFLAADPHGTPHLGDVSESDVGRPWAQFTFDGKRYSCSFLNYLRGLSYLKKLTEISGVHDVLEIGGGYGTLGEIFLKADPRAFYVDVDIPPVAAVA